MRLFILAAAVTISSTGLAADPKPAGNMPVVRPGGPINAKCPPISPYHAMKDRQKLGARKLSELPQGVHYKTAYRRVDGCEVPIIANFRPGARPSAPRR